MQQMFLLVNAVLRTCFLGWICFLNFYITQYRPVTYYNSLVSNNINTNRFCKISGWAKSPGELKLPLKLSAYGRCYSVDNFGLLTCLVTIFLVHGRLVEESVWMFHKFPLESCMGEFHTESANRSALVSQRRLNTYELWKQVTKRI